MEISYSDSLYESWKKHGDGLTWETWIKKQSKQVFLLIKEILELDLELPGKFVVLPYIKLTNREGREGMYVIASFSYSVDTNKRETRVTKIKKTKIAHSSRFDMTVSEFISNIGHEMVHYYDLVHNKRYPLDHGKKFKRIMKKWNKKLKEYGYGIEIKDGCDILRKL
jgi:hypothetical protein